MDTIEFRLSAFYNNTVTPQAVAHIFINGKDFSDTLYEFESRAGLQAVDYAPLAVAELHENLRTMSPAAEIYDRVIVNVAADDETVVWKIFDEFIFDRAQYFREVDKLKRWCDNDKLFIEYGGIECGFVALNFMQGGKLYNFGFDELLSDPFPQLVNLFVHIERGEPCAEELGDTYNDETKVLKISVQHDGDNVCLTAELIKKKIFLTETYRREELAAMFKKIFDALLNDRYFPYSYPCYGYIHEEDYLYEKLVDEKKYPNWSFGDVLNHAVASGQLKFSPRHEKYLEHYKKMLMAYVIPDKWFE